MILEKNYATFRYTVLTHSIVLHIHFDRYYFLTVTSSGEFSWRGKEHNSTIFSNGTHWLAASPFHAHVLSFSGAHPLGRHHWDAGEGDSRQLAFTAVFDGEFSTDINQYTQKDYRCDYYIDFDDSSDERGCEDILIKPPNYRTYIGPNNLFNYKDEKHIINFKMIVNAMGAFNNREKYVTSDFNFDLHWTDHAVDIQHLPIESEGSELKQRIPCDDIWRPTFNFKEKFADGSYGLPFVHEHIKRTCWAILNSTTLPEYQRLEDPYMS